MPLLGDIKKGEQSTFPFLLKDEILSARCKKKIYFFRKSQRVVWFSFIKSEVDYYTSQNYIKLNSRSSFLHHCPILIQRDYHGPAVNPDRIIPWAAPTSIFCVSFLLRHVDDGCWERRHPTPPPYNCTVFEASWSIQESRYYIVQLLLCVYINKCWSLVQEITWQRRTSWWCALYDRVYIAPADVTRNHEKRRKGS